MLCSRQHVVRAIARRGGGSQHETLRQDNRGLHVHHYDWAPLRWSRAMFAQMCGFIKAEATSSTPLVVNTFCPNTDGKENRVPCLSTDRTFASDSYKGVCAAGEPL